MKVELKPSQIAMIKYSLTKDLESFLELKKEQEKLKINTVGTLNNINDIKDILNTLQKL